MKRRRRSSNSASGGGSGLPIFVLFVNITS